MTSKSFSYRPSPNSQGILKVLTLSDIYESKLTNPHVKETPQRTSKSFLIVPPYSVG